MTENNNQPDKGTSASTIGRYWMMGAIAAMVVVGAVFAGIAAANLTTGGSSNDVDHIETGGDQPRFYGMRINPPWPKPELVLTDTSGNEYDIRAETEGYVTLIFLGYTHCPDFCPTHMLDIAETLNAMDDEDAEQVKVIFVTTDPERDTPDRLRQWLDLFNPKFVGLTSDLATIEEFQRSMGVQPAERAVTERSGPEGYEVGHSLFVFAFDRETELAHMVYPIGIERDEWLNDLTRLVREGYEGS